MFCFGSECTDAPPSPPSPSTSSLSGDPMSPRKNLWYGAVAVVGVLLLASQSHRTADAAATAAREKAIVSAQEPR